MQQIIIKHRLQTILHTKGTHRKGFREGSGWKAMQGLCRVLEAKACSEQLPARLGIEPREACLSTGKRRHYHLFMFHVSFEHNITDSQLEIFPINTGQSHFLPGSNMLDQEVNIYFSAFTFALMTKGIKPRFHQDLVYLFKPG